MMMYVGIKVNLIFMFDATFLKIKNVLTSHSEFIPMSHQFEHAQRLESFLGYDILTCKIICPKQILTSCMKYKMLNIS